MLREYIYKVEYIKQNSIIRLPENAICIKIIIGTEQNGELEGLKYLEWLEPNKS